MTRILLSTVALAAMTGVALADAATPADNTAVVTVVDNETSAEASELVNLSDAQMNEIAAGRSFQPIINNIAKIFGIPPGQLRQFFP